MKFNSIQVKLPLLIIASFALMILLVQFIVEQKMTSAINLSQEAEYDSRLQTVLQSIHGNFDRLARTGMVSTYREDFQDLTLRQLRQTYFPASDQSLAPFIIDSSGKVLLAPVALGSDSTIWGQAIMKQIKGSAGGSFTLPAAIQGKFWCVYRTFEPWSWTVGYLVPLEVKYRVVNQLNRTLWIVFGSVTLLVAIVLVWLIRVQLKPINALTEISAEMAQGNLERRIRTDRNDEIGILADHFNRMQFEIQQTIESLRRSEENLSTTLNSIGDAVIATDAKKRVTRINPVAEELTGWSADQAIGQPLEVVFRIVNQADRESAKSLAEEALTSGNVVSLDEDTLLIAQNGSEHLIDDSAAPIRNAENQILGVVLVFRDITEENALREQLLQSRKMDTIGQLAGGIAHDFNNMLGGIIGSAELLKRRLPKDQKNDKFLGMIVESAERAAELTSKLLAFARKQHVSSTPVDAHLALRNTLGILEATLDRRVKINLDLVAESSMVVGDLTQLQNVFLNLCLNAAQAMPEGGELSISSQSTELDQIYCDHSSFDLQAGTYLEIAFRDTGCGIPAERFEKIFEPFFTTKEQGRGTGLGLSAVLGTMQMHKGAVTVYSEEGAGTVFHILLPLTDDDPAYVAPVSQPLRGSGLILVVDDEAVMRATAAAILEELGYQVLLAETGQVGLEIFRERQVDIDLVLLDMIMPEMNGRDCFAEMRKLDPEVKVILSSGFTRSEDIVNLRAAGLLGFIRKPYRGVVLSQAVAAALSSDSTIASLWDG